MAWKGLHLSQSSGLRLKNRQILITQEDGEVTVSLEDLAYIVLDSNQISLTASLMSACMEAGIVIVSVNDKHMPNGLLLPFHSHHRQSEIAALQLSLSGPFKKRCWQIIVMCKIKNQSINLQLLGLNNEEIKLLFDRVTSGDAQNTEAQAARIYWKNLFKNFTRDNDADLRNKMLNYGYAIIRSAVARSIVACGLLPTLGLHHTSITNAFNLVDDIIEPFRPFVDALVVRRLSNRKPDDELTLEDRRALSGVLFVNSSMSLETTNLLYAIEKTTDALIQAIRSKSADKLCFPTFEKT
jgi:CRISPR-associated protein Cas1